MNDKTYTVKGHRKAADVLNNREEIIETGYTLEEARIAQREAERTREFVCAWIEEEAPASPRFDTLKFSVVVADAKAKTQDLRWLRAIDKAAEGILSGELIVTTLQHGALVTSPNGSYLANGSCGCKAAKHGHKECWHRAAGRLMELYETAPDLRMPARVTSKLAALPTGALWFSAAGA